MIRFRTLVGQSRHQPFRQLPLNRYIPLLDCWIGEAWIIRLHAEWCRKYQAWRGWRRHREWIHLPLIWILQTCWGVEYSQVAEGGDAELIVVHHPHRLVVIDSVACSKTGFAITEHVVGKANTGIEKIIVRVNARLGDARIAGDKQAGRKIWVLSGPRSGKVGARAKLMRLRSNCVME